MGKKSKILKDVNRVHLIGIGGIGMSGIAEFLVRKGYEVSGSDITLTDITGRLEKLGVKITEGHSKDNIDEDIDLVVYTAAVKKDNAEYMKVRDMKIPIMKRAVMLGYLVNDMYLIAVSGTHGKTSTTAMMAKVLIDSGYDPTVFVGGNLNFLEGASSRIGASKYAVVEADEYDRSFHTLTPDVAVITNIEHDHSDIYKDLKEIKKGFKEFCDNRKKGSTVIGFGDDENVRDVVNNVKKRDKVFYGLKKGNDYVVRNIEGGTYGMKFDINRKSVKLKVPGIHSCLNAAAVRIAAKEAGVKFKEFAGSIAGFTGVQRRLELKYDGEVKVYDDYAHHPTEVKATFEAVKRLNPRRVITVFQPHLYSRTKDFYKEFADALKDNDAIILAKIYPAREKSIEGVTSELILEEIKKIRDMEVLYLESESDIYKLLYSAVNTGDIVIFQGAGTVTNYCNEFVNMLKKREAENEGVVL